MKVLAAVLLLALATASQALTWKKPEFCGNSECPPFEVEDDRDSYEVRTYEGGHWVQYNVTDKKYEIAYTKASVALMKYFKGKNEAELTMDLTTPTLAALKLSKDSQESKRDYVFSLWLDPEDFKEEEDEKPPQPDDEDLEIKEYPEVTVFVRSFGGYATESTILNEVNALHEELISDKEDFDDEYVFVAVYDPAVKLLNRHNEVHVMKKPAPSKTVQVS
ncbi:hypothetical protein Ndes2526B_g07903 [Nannochloris sp. 'desiccata']|nr:hypothetical protein KSW81_002559 [Chlorella desiccata (nom. nud.)]KAH7617297.1 putative Heme-binding protein 2 [Chlorella desiccata (nom. nud.)]